MKFPSKVTTLRESVIYKMTVILEYLQDNPVEPDTLYHILRDQFKGTTEFIDSLDCLYMLQRIGLNEEGQIYAE